MNPVVEKVAVAIAEANDWRWAEYDLMAEAAIEALGLSADCRWPGADSSADGVGLTKDVEGVPSRKLTKAESMHIYGRIVPELVE